MCAAAPQDSFTVQHYCALKRGVNAAYPGGAHIGQAADRDDRRQHFAAAPILLERIIGGAHWAGLVAIPWNIGVANV